MSQTNTNTNNGFSNTKQNRISGRGGRDQGGPRSSDRGGRGNNHGTSSITKFSIEGKIKDGCISKLTITETGHQAIQYKRIVNTFPVLCVDKNKRGINDVFCNGIDLVKGDFTLAYSDTNRWSNTYNVEIRTVNPIAAILANGSYSQIIILERQMHIFNANL